MHEVQKLAVQRAIRVLEAAQDHLQFAIELDDTAYGNRKLAPLVAAKDKRNIYYPRGVTRKYYAPFFKGVKVGDVVEVPFGGFDGRVLSSNISATCVHVFGKGNATVHKNQKTQKIEVFITGVPDGMADMGEQIDMFADA